jgi:hypothetical protein
MVIESRLDRADYVRLMLFRRFTSTIFYLFALIGAALTAYAFNGGGGGLVVAAVSWVPLAIYSILSVAHAFLSSEGPNRPFLQMTRYDFGPKAISVSSRLGEGEIPWEEVKSTRKLLGCYVIDLHSGQFFAFPIAAVRQSAALDKLLSERIRPPLGVA